MEQHAFDYILTPIFIITIVVLLLYHAVVGQAVYLYAHVVVYYHWPITTVTISTNVVLSMHILDGNASIVNQMHILANALLLL